MSKPLRIWQFWWDRRSSFFSCASFPNIKFSLGRREVPEKCAKKKNIMVIFHYFFIQRNKGRRRVPTKARSWRGAPRKVRGRRRAPTKVSGVGAECRQRSGLGAGRQEKLENKKKHVRNYLTLYSSLLKFISLLHSLISSIRKIFVYPRFLDC